MCSDNVLSADNQQGRVRCTIDPCYVAGFVDGEGSFHIAIYKDIRMKTQWKIIPEFHISQRVSSRGVLDTMVEFFRCGYVKANHATNPSDQTYVYVVRDRDDLLQRIIPFFRRYNLHTEKAHDFETFASIVEMMANGVHRTNNGCQQIMNLAYAMNGSGRYRRKIHRVNIVKPSETIREIPE